VQIIPGEIIVMRPDGTDRRFFLDSGLGSFAGWSPDGTTILFLEDVGLHDDEFTVHAFDVDAGVDSVVVSAVKANGSRSFPDWRDISWQQIP
jgi:hypothetical protein